MTKKYLLGQVLQSLLFAVLVMFSTGKKTIIHFALFFIIFLVLSMGADFVFKKLVDRKEQKINKAK